MANLQRVIIRNFRNVADKEIILLGSNIISGANMSGKTNTLNAIHWAFTGVTLEGSSDNRANFPIDDPSAITQVHLDFGSFTFERRCEMVDGTPTMSILVDGFPAKTIKNGEAQLHAKLGLTDIILTQPKDFNIVRFLLDPLYFDTISPSALRKFLYMLSDTDFKELATHQIASVQRLLNEREIYDPYKLGDALAKDKKACKKVIDGCKVARDLFPSITDEANAKEKEQTKLLKSIEADEALAEKYALSVSKHINKYYEKAMGIKVCLLEKGVGEGVFKDVCYPILPKSNLPFHLGSQAEKTYVGMKFINEVCLTWNIKPLPILLDNMESLDEHTQTFVNDLGVQYIGALVK